MKKSIRHWRGVNCWRNESTPADLGSSPTHIESRQANCVAPGVSSERGRAHRRPMKTAACATPSPTAVKSDRGEIRSLPTLTVGDLVVELTDDARRFVHNEQELYEVVAYLVERRLRRRRRTDEFLATVRRHVPARGSRVSRVRRPGRFRFSR